jgi:hypothetical protein
VSHEKKAAVSIKKARSDAVNEMKMGCLSLIRSGWSNCKDDPF